MTPHSPASALLQKLVPVVPKSLPISTRTIRELGFHRDRSEERSERSRLAQPVPDGAGETLKFPGGRSPSFGPKRAEERIAEPEAQLELYTHTSASAVAEVEWIDAPEHRIIVSLNRVPMLS